VIVLAATEHDVLGVPPPIDPLLSQSARMVPHERGSIVISEDSWNAERSASASTGANSIR
jgi:hypothetical protein